MELIYQRLLDATKETGIGADGSGWAAFRPEFPSRRGDGADGRIRDNTVLEEYQRGYSFRGKLLRRPW